MIKKITICILLATAIISCKNSKSTSETAEKDTITSQTTATSKTIIDTAKFDVNSIPISTKDIGKFPYLTYPDGYNFNYQKEIKADNIKDIDKEYFAANGKLYGVEGKSFKVRIEKDQNNDKKFSSLLVERYYDEKITALGGVKVNNVPVTNQEIKRIGDNELITKQYGHSIDYNLLDDIKTYVIRTATKEIWIQMTLMDNEVGKLTVLEKDVVKN